MSEDLREGRIRTAVYSKRVDIIESKAPANIRSGNESNQDIKEMTII